jgi:hypothetical protein
MATLRCGVVDGERMLRLNWSNPIVAPSSERSAARLAHQSGGQRRDFQQASDYVVELVLT